MVIYDKHTQEYQFLNLSQEDDETFLHQIEQVAEDETIAVISYPHFKVVHNKVLMLGEAAAIQQMKDYFLADLHFRIKEVDFLKEKSRYIYEQEEMKNGFSFCFARKEYTYPSIIQHLFTTKLNLI